MYLPNINALRGISSLPTPMEEFIVAGHYVSGDGGGGTFTWVAINNPTNLLNDDGGIVIRTNNALNPLYEQGYFKRIYSGPINVRWFGAKGDGVTDDTAAVHAAAKAAQYGTLYFPSGDIEDPNSGNVKMAVYLGSLKISNANVQGDGRNTVLIPKDKEIPVLCLGWKMYPSHWVYT